LWSSSRARGGGSWPAGSAVGEEPAAFVVLRPGLAAEPDELIEHCKNVLAKFKVPRAVFIEVTLPRTPIGKIAKPVLRERISSPT
jgi:acyl-CoA synthetase (AMP-forming)/AMP-acid ligase II